MPAAHATAPLLPEGATALEIPSDRPAYYDSFKAFGVPAAATAVRLVTPLSEMCTSRPASISVYMPPSPPEMVYFANCFAYAYITPATAPCRADLGAFIRGAFRAQASDLSQDFELLPPGHGGDATVRFRTPDDREAAMRRQPFELDGATVKFVREGETSNVNRVSYDYIAHVALRDYPVEQRTEEHITANCGRFGFLREVDPACFTAPDLATVHVVLQLEHPREIPHQVRIGYFNGSKNVVPVELVAVWDRAHSYDADARLVRPATEGGVNRAATALVEPSAYVPQTGADYVVREAVIRQAVGNAGGVKTIGNVGVEPDAATVRKNDGATIRGAATSVGHLAGGNALVKRPAAAGGGDPNLGISKDIQAAFPSVSPLKNFSKNRGKNVEKKTFPKISTPQKTTPTKNTSKETTTKKATPKKMNTKETTLKKTTPKKMNTMKTTPKKKITPRKKHAKATPKKDDDVDMIQLDSDDDFLDIEAEMEQEEMDIQAVRPASAHPAEVLGENFPAQSLDWNVVEVESMDEFRKAFGQFCIMVNKMGPPHMCPTGCKLKSSMATQEWVEKHALSMLNKMPNYSAKLI
ncbi:hypothetical protein ACQ4PT_002139 [Festuca glaucescens]